MNTIKLNRDFRDFTQRHPSVMRLVKILFLFFMILHVMSCTYWRMYLSVKARYFNAANLVESESYEDYCDPDTLEYVGNRTEPDSFEYKYCTSIDTMWRPYEETLASSRVIDAYATSLYWSLLIVLGSSVEPTNRLEYGFSIATTIFGMLVFAVIIGSSSSLITSLDSEGEARIEQMNAINQVRAGWGESERKRRRRGVEVLSQKC
jgi:hypothetical protein